MNIPGSQRAGRVARWLRRSAALVIACVSAIILGYAAGVFVADINDSNSSAPPPARNPALNPVITPARTTFPWIAVLIPVVVILLLVLFRKRRPVQWMLHRAKTAAETYALPLPPELLAPIAVSPASLSRAVVPQILTTAAAGVQPPADELAGESEPVEIATRVPVAARAPFVSANAATAVGKGSGRDSIMCVLTFRDESPVGQASKRTMTVARGFEPSRRAIEKGFGLGRDSNVPVGSASRQLLDVVSVFGVDNASADDAYEASVELGRWIEAAFGLKLLVASGPPGGGAPAPDHREAADSEFANVFFGTSAKQVEMYGLVPLAVYARIDTPLVTIEPASATPIKAIEPEPVVEPEPIVEPQPIVEPEPIVEPQPVAAHARVVAPDLDDSADRKICTMFDMLNELLAQGDAPRDDDSHLYASSR